MSETSSASQKFTKTVLDVGGEVFESLFETADAFICAAGFERRCERVPLSANVRKNPVVIAYTNGPVRNDRTLKKFVSKFERLPGYDVCELDFAHPEKFESRFEKIVSRLPVQVSGRIIFDISGFPNFAICTVIAKIRRLLPLSTLILIHTEAEEYFPRKKDFTRIERAMDSRPVGLVPEYLSERAVNMFFPSIFSGVALGHNDTCLMIFVGYEPHRTNCVIEALNPSKLVMIYGEPARLDLKWRNSLSRIMHKGIDDRLLKTDETSSTGEIDDNLRLILEYYNILYDDHVLCVSPINSKMQAVASVLAWEIYPDIQLNFPMPSQYLASRFSINARDTFMIDLGRSLLGSRFI